MFNHIKARWEKSQKKEHIKVCKEMIESLERPIHIKPIEGFQIILDDIAKMKDER